MSPYNSLAQAGVLARALVLVVIGAALGANTAEAQYTWVNSNNQSGQWNQAARWTGGTAGTFPNATDSTATFNRPTSNSPDGNYNVQLSNTAGQSITVGGITVNNYSDGGVQDINALRFGANGNGTLTFQVTSGSAFYTENAASPTDGIGATNIFAPVTFASNTIITQNHRLDNNAGTAFSSTGNSPGGITAAPGITLTKEGAGNIQFEVAPSGPGTGFQGALVINGGGVRLEANTFDNASGVTVNSGGQFHLGSGTVGNWSLADGASLVLNGLGKPSGANFAGAFRYQNQNSTATFNNPVELASDASIFVNATVNPTPPALPTYGRLVLPEVVSGAGKLIKVGSGILELSHDNSYAGGTSIDAGILLVTNTGGSATGDGPITVNLGAALAGTGTVAGSVSFVGGAFAPGSSPGLITLGGAVFDATSQLLYELGTPNLIDTTVSDLAQINGGLTLDGTLSVTPLSGFGAGTYRLFNYTGSLTDNGLDLGLLPSGLAGLIDVSTPNQVNLVVSAVPEPSTWALGLFALAGTMTAARRRQKRGSE